MINFSQFTITNGAITDLRELMFLTVFNDPDLEQVITNRTGVRDGQKLGFIDDMGEVGKAGGGCNPTYENVQITGLEKEWNLGDWEIAKHICYKDLENTIAADSMNTGTERAELQGTPYWDTILMPLLQRAMVQMFWRIVWFGDKDAANISDSGIITNGIDTDLFSMCDGLWKRFFAIAAANSGQRTEIEANAKDTTAEQKAGLRESGAAMKIVDNILMDADSRIFDSGNQVLYMTDSLFRALRADVVDKYGKTTMPFEYVGNGLVLSKYDGQAIMSIPTWDRMIKKYENNGTKLNNPHRALLGAPTNWFVGTNDTDKVADLRVTFNDETQYNNIYAMSKIGTLVGEDALIHVAY